MDKNTKIGIISNIIALCLLLGIGWVLDIMFFSFLSISFQWFIYFVHGRPNKSEKFYDISGSGTHLALVLSSLIFSPNLHPRGIILSIFSVMWLTRLGSYLYFRILRDGRDDRFDTYKVNELRFLGVWTIQALWVFLLQLPVLIINSIEQNHIPLGLLDAIGIVLWAVGFLIEAVADTQKSVFRSREENRKKFITEGLWAYSQHPNYLGEHMIWTGVCLSGTAVFVGVQYLAWLSLGITALLLWKVSGIPHLEKAGKEKWGGDPAYNHYISKTNKFFLGAPAPLLPKKAH